MKWIKIIFRTLVYSVLLLFVFVVACNIWVVVASRKYVCDKIEGLPNEEYAIVLGTSKKLMSGEPNLFFYYRIKAASELYEQKKIKNFILSGDNFTRYYNEPRDMRTALVKLGVPDSVITLDVAGYRTINSVVNGKAIFGKSNFIIITQRFHAYRAIFISQHYGINAYAYAAKSISFKKSFKVELREFFARPKAVIDIYILRKRINLFD